MQCEERFWGPDPSDLINPQILALGPHTHTPSFKSERTGIVIQAKAEALTNDLMKELGDYRLGAHLDGKCGSKYF